MLNRYETEFASVDADQVNVGRSVAMREACAGLVSVGYVGATEST
jgi:hypothetical protein